MANAKLEFVTVYDFDTNRKTNMPRSELAPGMVRITLDHSGEILWADSRQLKVGQSPYQHKPFVGTTREKICYIQQSLANVHYMSYAAWEDGFRRDLHAEQEINLWLRLAHGFNAFIRRQVTTLPEREEAFKVLAACINATPETVFDTISTRLLDPALARCLVTAYYRTPGEMREIDWRSGDKS